MQVETHPESEPMRAQAEPPMPVRAFFARGRLRGPLGRVAWLVARPQAHTRREISRESGLAYARVELALEELRLLFLAPQQGQLPLRIVHELIGSILQNGERAYRLPCDRGAEPPCWLGSLPPLRASFDASIARRKSV